MLHLIQAAHDELTALRAEVSGVFAHLKDGGRAALHRLEGIEQRIERALAHTGAAVEAVASSAQLVEGGTSSTGVSAGSVTAIERPNDPHDDLVPGADSTDKPKADAAVDKPSVDANADKPSVDANADKPAAT